VIKIDLNTVLYRAGILRNYTY